MSDKTINILYLYSHDMNIYGDHGNVLTLQKRLQWRGYKSEVIEYNQGDEFPNDIDIVVGGGGQDSGQNKIQEDLLLIGERLHELAEDGTPMLMICGLYQLFGRFFKTTEGDIIEGIGIFDAETHAGPERLIGNVTLDSKQFGKVIGYENHSGQTFLGDDIQPLGAVRIGAGNNGSDGFEGALFNNVIGSYLHGPLLPKNPAIADFLIETAIHRKFGEVKPHQLDDKLSDLARKTAFKRPR